MAHSNQKQDKCAECKKLAEENKRLRAEIEDLRKALARKFPQEGD